MQNQQYSPELEQTIDVKPSPISEETSKRISFDRYEVIGLLLLMLGWWRLISGAWLIALGCMVVGWVLAFAEGTKRESLVRIIGSISSDVLALLNTGFQKVRRYIAEKQRPGSSEVSK